MILTRNVGVHKLHIIIIQREQTHVRGRCFEFVYVKICAQPPGSSRPPSSGIGLRYSPRVCEEWSARELEAARTVINRVVVGSVPTAMQPRIIRAQCRGIGGD